jgi:hypothetical protein
MTGIVLGGAAIVFTEMTEGLGCLLGGFCFSMWLLVLKPGGLLTATSSKSIFIASFTIASFSTSFSHYTRPYGLIVSISFSGATAIILGLDCFSRAGLKEFWAYLWALNTNLFPLGATSYPLTRGIRVEIAAIVVIFLAGIVSQMKLWKVIKERREQRAAVRLQDERNMEQEEENVGRRIEHANAQERDEWEAVYGDKDKAKNLNRDSGLGDMDSQKKGPMSSVTTVRRSASDDEIEMSEMASPALTTGAGLVMTNDGQDGAITVRVARDPQPEPELDEEGNVIEKPSNRDSMVSPRSSTPQGPEAEKVWVVGTDGEARMERRLSRKNSKRKSGPTVSPDVVPLPFKVPEGEEVDDERSSVATFADEEQAGTKRRSSTKRLSAASALIRRLSKRSHRRSKSYEVGDGISTEDLFIPRGVEDDRASSIAATMDGLSDDEDMRSIRSSVRQAPDTAEAAHMSEEVEASERPASPSKPTTELAVPEPTYTNRPISDATVATTILEPDLAMKEPEDVEAKVDVVVSGSLTSSTDPKVQTESVAEPPLAVAKSRRGNSIASASDSRPASITRDRLPAQLSRVVMSYRTNEWAKHLSNADAPDLEELKLAEYPVQPVEAQKPRRTVTETVAPVNVEELQQTPENAMPRPASRSVSQMSNHPSITRSTSAQSNQYAPVSSTPKPEVQTSFNSQDPILVRSSSQHSLSAQGSQTNLAPRGFRSSSQPHIPQPIVESPVEGDFQMHTPNPSIGRNVSPNVPFGSTTTLISKRDSMMRNKTSFYPHHQSLASTPEIPHYASGAASRAGSDAGSIYNYPNTNAVLYDDDEDMSLSARRDLIRQNSLVQTTSSVPVITPLQNTPIPFDSHQPRRSSGAPTPLVREQQMASWRASVQQELFSGVQPKVSIERQRNTLWHERQQEEQRRAVEERRRTERDSQFDERMRRGDMSRLPF